MKINMTPVLMLIIIQTGAKNNGTLATVSQNGAANFTR